MDDKITSFVNGLKNDSFSLVRGEFVGFVDGLKTNTDEFSQKQHAKLEQLLLQIAAQQITRQQFADGIADMKELADMEVSLEKVETKASAQRLSEGLQKLVISALLKAIPG